MARRHEPPKALKQEVEKKSDNVLAIVSVFALVICTFINSQYPNTVPDLVFWVLAVSISKDVLKFVKVTAK